MHQLTESQLRYVRSLVLQRQELDRTLEGFLKYIADDAGLQGSYSLSNDCTALVAVQVPQIEPAKPL